MQCTRCVVHHNLKEAGDSCNHLWDLQQMAVLVDGHVGHAGAASEALHLLQVLRKLPVDAGLLPAAANMRLL